MSLPSDLIGQCSPDERQAILKAAWIVAFSDGRLYAEKSLLQKIREELEVESGAARQVEHEVRSGKAKFSVPVTEVGRRVMYHYALRMSASDSKIRSAERKIALRLGEALGLSRDQIRAELSALVPQKADTKPAPAQPPQAQFSSQPKTLEKLLVAIGGDSIVESQAVSYLLNRQSALVILLTNLMPVFGVIFLDWQVFAIVFLYWLETIVIGLFQLARIIAASIQRKSGFAFFIGPFFTLHYGGFVVVHGVFVFALFREGAELSFFPGFLGEFTLGIVVAIIFLTGEHAYLFYTAFLQTGAGKKSGIETLLFAPYPRIVVLHCSIIFGAYLIEAYQIRSLVLVVLVPLKIVVDLVTLWVMERHLQRRKPW